MKITMKIGVVIGALAVLGTAGGVLATVATASSSTITATTQVVNAPDTTSGGTGTACTSSSQGPVWALDTYTNTLTAVNTGTDTWQVTLTANGSFAGFADPTTCNAMTSQGSLLGMITYQVTSTGTPSQANLKSSYSTGDLATMVDDFFNDPSATLSGGAYFYSYQNGAYVQWAGQASGDSGITGDVTAYAAPPPVLVKIPTVVGLSANAALAKVRAAGFVSYTSPLRNPAYTYVATGTSPSGSAPKGSTVVVLVKRT